jgi:rRNA maturation endonuclease Nob1
MSFADVVARYLDGKPVEVADRQFCRGCHRMVKAILKPFDMCRSCTARLYEEE